MRAVFLLERGNLVVGTRGVGQGEAVVVYGPQLVEGLIGKRLVIHSNIIGNRNSRRQYPTTIPFLFFSQIYNLLHDHSLRRARVTASSFLAPQGPTPPTVVEPAAIYITLFILVSSPHLLCRTCQPPWLQTS